MGQALTKEYLKNLQYGTTKNLEVRIKIHQLFSTNPESFHSWVGGHLKIDMAIDVLEVGCGTGIFWKETLHRLPEGSQLHLTDFSEAMVEKCRANFDRPFVKVEIADVEALPYPDSRFDLVNAHHVIYHTSHKEKAFREIKRVLKQDGQIIVWVPVAVVARLLSVDDDEFSCTAIDRIEQTKMIRDAGDRIEPQHHITRNVVFFGAEETGHNFEMRAFFLGIGDLIRVGVDSYNIRAPALIELVHLPARPTAAIEDTILFGYVILY